jgi:hypothetical protein
MSESVVFMYGLVMGGMGSVWFWEWRKARKAGKR